MKQIRAPCLSERNEENNRVRNEEIKLQNIKK